MPSHFTGVSNYHYRYTKGKVKNKNVKDRQYIGLMRETHILLNIDKIETIFKILRFNIFSCLYKHISQRSKLLCLLGKIFK